ncbi:MAG: GNAT family N-acetyltransferase [Ruminococcus sp.]|nr:GNAT family N-acetyltransferase [Ruminococcus sp.]
MMNITIKYNELTVEQYIDLWDSVWSSSPSYEQTKLAMEHSLFRVSVFDNDEIIAMARVIGDMGLCYYIKDVIVRPKYQGNGIGRVLIDEILRYIDKNGISGTTISVELAAMPDKVPFYEKFGFSANEAKRLRLMYHVK